VGLTVGQKSRTYRGKFGRVRRDTATRLSCEYGPTRTESFFSQDPKLTQPGERTIEKKTSENCSFSRRYDICRVQGPSRSSSCNCLWVWRRLWVKETQGFHVAFLKHVTLTAVVAPFTIGTYIGALSLRHTSWSTPFSKHFAVSKWSLSHTTWEFQD
jgi:hypothetical protein